MGKRVGSKQSEAREGEATFLLLGRDEASHVAIRAWIEERIRLGKNKPGDTEIVEAERIAAAMEGDRRVAVLEARIERLVGDVERLRGIVQRGHEQARRWYHADGTFHLLDTPEQVVKERIKAAGHLWLVHNRWPDLIKKIRTMLCLSVKITRTKDAEDRRDVRVVRDALLAEIEGILQGTGEFITKEDAETTPS